jgi:hypothetical protein
MAIRNVVYQNVKQNWRRDSRHFASLKSDNEQIVGKIERDLVVRAVEFGMGDSAAGEMTIYEVPTDSNPTAQRRNLERAIKSPAHHPAQRFPRPGDVRQGPGGRRRGDIDQSERQNETSNVDYPHRSSR